MSLQLLTILSPPTPCTPVLRSLCSPQARSRSCRFPFRVGFRSGLHLTPSRVRQCIRPYRVHHFLNYGLVIRFRLLPTPSLDDAVAFSYGQPVLCPAGSLTPLLVRTLRRTRDVLRAVRLTDIGRYEAHCLFSVLIKKTKFETLRQCNRRALRVPSEGDL